MLSLRNSEEKYLSSPQDAINKAIECLTSTPNMTIIKLLHLQKLFEISGCPKGRVLLGKIYVPRVGYILNMQSSQYIKYKLLEVLANTCSVNQGNDFWPPEIDKDKKLAEFIFCSFAKSTTNKNFRLQNTLLELLSSILCELSIRSNINTSAWIYHFKSLNYDFGSAIINILLQRTEVSVFNEILGLIGDIFDLRIPYERNMLERLFKTDNLVDVLLKKFSTTFCVTDRLYYTKHWRVHYYWKLMESWVSSISVFTSLESFRRNPCYYDIGIRIVHIMTYILRSFIYIVSVNDLTEFYVSNISQNGRQEMTFGPNATYRSITLLLRFFLIHKNLLNITELIKGIVKRIYQYLQYVYIIQENHFLEERGTLRVLDYLEEYDEHLSMIERSYKNIPEEEFIWAQHHNISPNDTYKIKFRVKSNVQRNTEKCQKEVILMNNIVSIYSKKQKYSQTFKSNTCKYEYGKCLIH